MRLSPWTVLYFSVYLSTASCATYYFVHDAAIHDAADLFCSRQFGGGSMSGLSADFDWGCVPQDVWFWTNQDKYCKLNKFNKPTCKNMSFLNHLGIGKRAFICRTESDMDYDDLDYQGNNISLCLSPTPYPDTTTEPSTPTPRNPSLVSSSTTHRSSNDADHGWLAGVVLGIIVVLVLIGCAVFFFVKRRKRSTTNENGAVNSKSRHVVERSETITSRIGSAVQKCRQKFQRSSPSRDYEMPNVNRPEREYDQLNVPMLPVEMVYAEPTAPYTGSVQQDELGYLVSQGGEFNEYTYIDTTGGDTEEGTGDSAHPQAGMDCGNPVYEDMSRREVITAKRDKPEVDKDSKPKAAGAAGAITRKHEYLNSPVIGRLMTEEQKGVQSKQKKINISIVNGTYDDKLCTSSASSRDTPPLAAPGDSKVIPTDDNSESLAKNVKGSNIRNIILKLQGATDA